MESKNELPEGWREVLLRELVIDAQPGFAEGDKKVSGGVPQLRMNNITQNGELNLSLIRTVNADEIKIRKYALRRGDILFNNTNSLKLVGKTALFDLEGTYLYSNHLTRIRVDENKVDANYLSKYLYYLYSDGYFEHICKSWVNQSAVSKDKLLEITVQIPDIQTQHKIISKLDIFLKELAIIAREQEHILQITQLLPRSLLKKAFSNTLLSEGE